MTNGKLRIFKCEVCDTVVETLFEGGWEIVCCGREMQPLPEQCFEDGSQEHRPILLRTKAGVTVRVGAATHPSDEADHIDWIEVSAGGKCYRRFLNPGDAPEATFDLTGDDVVARAYCNCHGLWRSHPASGAHRHAPALQATAGT